MAVDLYQEDRTFLHPEFVSEHSTGGNSTVDVIRLLSLASCEADTELASFLLTSDSLLSQNCPQPITTHLRSGYAALRHRQCLVVYSKFRRILDDISC